jgi:hypothetical protein
MAKKNLRIHSSRMRRRTLQFFEFYNKMTTTSFNEEDVVKLNIPLIIRLFEFAREDAKNDQDLHWVAERLINHSTTGKTLTMQDYKSLTEYNP